MHSEAKRDFDRKAAPNGYKMQVVDRLNFASVQFRKSRESCLRFLPSAKPEGQHLVGGEEEGVKGHCPSLLRNDNLYSKIINYCYTFA